MLIAARSSHDFACLLCNRERPFEIRFRFRHIRVGRLKRDFSGQAMNLGLPPPIIGCFERRYRLANGAPGVIELTEFA